MNKKLRYLLGFILVLVLGFVGFIVSTTFRGSLQYYVTVSELRASEPTYANKILKVAGIATDITKTSSNEGGLNYAFSVDEGGQTIKVSFAGFVPDTFKEGSEVVVTGQLKPDGTFQATDILAKCASKYEAKLK